MSSSTAARPSRLGRPRGADGDATRERIIDAALEAFAAHGYDAMSVRELTRDLGVSHNLVHHYFGTKSDLWYAAIDDRLGSSADEIFAQVGRAVGIGDPADAIRSVLELTFLRTRANPSVFAILAEESRRPGERLDYLYERFLEPGMALVRQFLEASRPHPMCDLDSRAVALHVWSVVVASSAQRALQNKVGYATPKADAPLAPYEKFAIEVLLHGLLGGRSTG